MHRRTDSDTYYAIFQHSKPSIKLQQNKNYSQIQNLVQISQKSMRWKSTCIENLNQPQSKTQRDSLFCFGLMLHSPFSGERLKSEKYQLDTILQKRAKSQSQRKTANKENFIFGNKKIQGSNREKIGKGCSDKPKYFQKKGTDVGKNSFRLFTQLNQNLTQRKQIKKKEVKKTKKKDNLRSKVKLGAKKKKN